MRIRQLRLDITLKRIYYIKGNMKVKIYKKGHANLDSFPFRYGVTFEEDTFLEIGNVTNRRDEKNVTNRRDETEDRYHIDAYFLHPKKGHKVKGHFVLVNDKDNTVVTVWRSNEDSLAETKLSETIRSARERKKIAPEDLILMHERGLRTIDDFIDFLAEKLSKEEIEVVQKDAAEEIAKLSNALGKLAKERDLLKSKLENLTKDAYDPRNSGGDWNPGIFTICPDSVRWGKKGKFNQDAVFITLEDENGNRFDVANNWERGLESRYEQAKLLEGHQIKYSTWGSYSKDWFKNIKSVSI